MKVFKKYKFTITALSPIHIGTGDELMPFEYVIKDDMLYFIDLVAMLANLPANLRNKYDYAVNQSNLIYIRQFIRNNVDLKRFSKLSVPVCEKLSELYEKNLNNSDNQLMVNSFIRRLDSNDAIIPGSSIKGAIRTAVVSDFTQTRYNEKNDESIFRDKHWENMILKCSDPKDDPFRAVSIEDITLTANSTIIDETVIYKPEKSYQDPAGIQQFYEMTYSILEGKKVSGSGFLTFYTGLQNKEYADKYNNKKKAVSMILNAEMLAQTCKKFYSKLIDYEHKKFYTRERKAELEPVSNRLKEEVSKLAQNEFPIRLGRFSHCEAVTIDVELKGGDGITPRQLRQPRTKRGKNGQPLPWGTTRTLAADYFPMGWAKCRFDEV